MSTSQPATPSPSVHRPDRRQSVQVLLDRTDDALRRGRPTTHVAFDVPTATRAGYLLVPVAARVLAAAADALALPPAALGRMAVELFRSGGIQGMVGGQWLDLEAEGRTLALADLIAVHRGKTGALIRAACTLGAIAAEAGPTEVAALTDYGEDIGLAFQIADDVLDATGTSEELGKTAGRDAQLAKSTYVSVMGVDAARAEAEPCPDVQGATAPASGQARSPPWSWRSPRRRSVAERGPERGPTLRPPRRRPRPARRPCASTPACCAWSPTACRR